MKHAFAITLATIAAASMVATASAEQLCIGQNVAPGPDGRMLGHIPYGQARLAELVAAPPGFAIGLPCYLRPEVAVDLRRMLAAAATVPGLAGRIRAVSCHRTVARQRAVFCSQIGPGKRCRDAAERARSVGPPGYSEHATGYAIDFGTRPLGNCGDVSACFGDTRAGQWLLTHASDFGFELSFPDANAQGVTWEPWHWRWVGVTPDSPGAAAARTIFARARRDFAARPAVIDRYPVITTPPVFAEPAPVAPPPGWPTPVPSPIPGPVAPPPTMMPR